VRTLKNFEDTHILGASRGLLCDSSAVLLVTSKHGGDTRDGKSGGVAEVIFKVGGEAKSGESSASLFLLYLCKRCTANCFEDGSFTGRVLTEPASPQYVLQHQLPINRPTACFDDLSRSRFSSKMFSVSYLTVSVIQAVPNVNYSFREETMP